MQIHQSDHAQLIHKFKERYRSFVQAELASDVLESLNHAISPFAIEFPKSVLLQAEDVVTKLYAHSRSQDQLQKLEKYSVKPLLPYLKAQHKNSSVLMAYDFHLDVETGNLKLIEINTNASGFLLSSFVCDVHGLLADKARNDLLKSFQEELSYFQTEPRGKVAIVDENIPAQKMYSEFLAYQSFFQSAGWNADLVELQNLNPEHFDLIYNRTTDFYFESAASEKLKAAYLSGTKCITPNPKEYLLLSDKERLLDFANALNDPHLLQVTLLNAETAESLWENRKKIFFKPVRAFGGRGVYNGASISRKVFDRITQEAYLAQEFCPPITKDDWKIDLRFYVYKTQIQHSTARVYKGQVTGFRDLGSGFAPIKFT